MKIEKEFEWEFRIPNRYNRVIDYYQEKGDFEYLIHEEGGYDLPWNKVERFYLDLREKLPRMQLMKKGVDVLRIPFRFWKDTLKMDNLSLLGDIDITFEDIRLYLFDDLKPRISEKFQEVDWEKVGKIVLIILFILFILAIIIGIAIIADGNVPFDGTFLRGFEGINIGGGGGERKNKEDWSGSL